MTTIVIKIADNFDMTFILKMKHGIGTLMHLFSIIKVLTQSIS